MREVIMPQEDARTSLLGQYDTDSAVEDDAAGEEDAAEDDTGEDTETDQAEGTDDEDGEPAGDDDDEDGSGDTETDTDESDKLDPKEQKKVVKKIGQLTARAKGAEEKLEASEAKVTELEKVKDGHAAGAMRLGIHPDYLSDGEISTLNQYDQLLNDEAFYEQIQEAGVEHVATGRGADTENVTPEQATKRLGTVSKNLRPVSAKAERLLDERKKQMFEDMRVGRKVRLGEQEAPAGDKSKKAKKKSSTPKPANVPGRGSSSRQAPAGSRKSTSTVLNQKEVREKGVTRESLAAAYETTI